MLTAEIYDKRDDYDSKIADFPFLVLLSWERLCKGTDKMRPYRSWEIVNVCKLNNTCVSFKTENAYSSEHQINVHVDGSEW